MTQRWPGPLPRLIGHRGAAALAPENTLAGLRAAAETGVWWVEVDTRLTADGVPVLMHDATLDRTTNGMGRVRCTQFADLVVLDAGGWFDARFADEPVPTLAQAMALAAALGRCLNIELKPDPDTVGATGESVARAVAGRDGSFLLSCFDADCLAAVRAVAPALPLALNAERLTDGVFASAVDLGCAALHLGVDGATGTALAKLHDAGMASGVFTVNDPALAERLRAAGADYLFTDDPSALASF
jgi:glycerophosphoryl diester phosphodiesterase